MTSVKKSLLQAFEEMNKHLHKGLSHYIICLGFLQLLANPFTWAAMAQMG